MSGPAQAHLSATNPLLPFCDGQTPTPNEQTQGLYVLDQGVKAAKVHPPSPEEQKEALNNLINGWVG